MLYFLAAKARRLSSSWPAAFWLSIEATSASVRPSAFFTSSSPLKAPAFHPPSLREPDVTSATLNPAGAPAGPGAADPPCCAGGLAGPQPAIIASETPAASPAAIRGDPRDTRIVM